jgi:hypothetical protein
MSRTSFPAHSASGPVARLIRQSFAVTFTRQAGADPGFGTKPSRRHLESKQPDTRFLRRLLSGGHGPSRFGRAKPILCLWRARRPKWGRTGIRSAKGSKGRSNAKALAMLAGRVVPFCGLSRSGLPLVSPWLRCVGNARLQSHLGHLGGGLPAGMAGARVLGVLVAPSQTFIGSGGSRTESRTAWRSRCSARCTSGSNSRNMKMLFLAR